MGSLFLPTGLRKLLDPDVFAQYLAKAGMFAPLPIWARVAAAIEFFGALAVVVGLKTRFAALLMILFSIAAAFLGHQFWNLDGPAYFEQRINFWKDISRSGLQRRGCRRHSSGPLDRRAMFPPWRVPRARRQVMEPNQVHLVAAAMSCDSQQIIHALEPRFTGQIVRDVGDGNWRNRVHDDVALVHPVPPTHLHMWTRPDANAAPDSPAADSLAKAFGEQHMSLHPVGTGRRK